MLLKSTNKQNKNKTKQNNKTNKNKNKTKQNKTTKQTKTKTTFNNRLKKTRHYNYFPIYSISLLFLFLSEMLLFKQENEDYSKYL
jgi:hypothetical protein